MTLFFLRFDFGEGALSPLHQIAAAEPRDDLAPLFRNRSEPFKHGNEIDLMIDPVFREAVGDEEMVGQNGLAFHAVDAARDELARLRIIRRDDGKAG